MPATESLLAVPHELAAEQFELVLRRLADDLTYGADPSRFVGPGVDYAQTRLFAPGDPIRSIDWRVTARTGRFHVKEYEAPKRTAMFLLVDTSASMAASSQPLSKHDAAVWIAATLALVALRRRSPVAILGCGQRGGSPSPTLSRGQVWRWIEQLRAASLQETTRLADAALHVESVAFHTASIIILSDLHDPDATPVIRRLAQAHDTIVLQLQDPAELGNLRAGFLRAREAESARDFLAASRTRWFVPAAASTTTADQPSLADAGVDHLILRTDQPILPSLRRLLESRGRGWRKRQMTVPARLILLALVLLLTHASRGADPLASTTIGLESRVIYRYQGPPLRAAPVNEKAPLVLRIDSSAADGPFTLYDLRFIAQTSGDFDLRDYLQRQDGGPMDTAPAIPVHITALLPANAPSDLIEIRGIRIPRLGGYRLALIILAALWLSPLVLVIVRRFRNRRRAAPPPPVNDKPTLADQLRPLVELAISGHMPDDQRARLEWLLLAYRRDRLSLRALAPIDALAQLRTHSDAGPLLLALEHWLHRPPHNGSPSDPFDILPLLRPYRDAAPIQEAVA